MESVAWPGWSRRVVGRDRALVRLEGGSGMAFGLGPARAESGPGERLAAVVAEAGLGLAAVRRCRQVHGCRVRSVDGAGPAILEVGDGDALVTTEPGVGLAVVTADCVPVLVVGGGAAAAVHAGWRGCAADIARTVVEVLGHRFGAATDTLRVALGPSICGSCYQVGPEVAAALGAFGVDEGRWRRGDRVDLRAFLRARFESLGVPTERVQTVGGCTLEDPELASYRRDGELAGRQWSMVFLTGIEGNRKNPQCEKVRR